MAIRSEDILDTASCLLLKDDEAGYRSCISRSYYGMYHKSIESLSCVPSYSTNHHSNLIGYMTSSSECKLEACDPKALRLMGYNLKQMRDARNEADYRISEVTVSKEMAETALESASLFFSKWQDLKE